MLSRFWPGPVTLAALLTLALVAWMASGAIDAFREDEPEQPVPVAVGALRVETRWVEAEAYSPRLVLQGQIEPWQQVEVAAQVAATVEALPLELGTELNRGDVFAQLSVDTRREQVARYEAEVDQRERELAANERLRGTNMQTETAALRLRSELAASRAELAAARQALAHTRPAAPFAAMLDRHLVEVGDFVQPGTPLARLVAIDRLKVTAQVPQQEVAHLQPGQAVDVDLLDGRRLGGTLVFVASAAEAGTRSFRIEVEVANPERLRIAGASATLRVHLPTLLAHRLSPALLVLDRDGRLGVRVLDDDDRVADLPARLLSVDNDGARLADLPPRLRLITRGGGFVAVGERAAAIEID
ncbi:MAG: efflux RND transporter periplasmic adaptor subunit [Rhodocyclaceae bacterium]